MADISHADFKFIVDSLILLFAKKSGHYASTAVHRVVLISLW